MARGMAIIGLTLAIAGTILMFTFKDMIANPPPVTLMKKPTVPTTPTPAVAGQTTITIASGASVQGSKSFEPDQAQVPLGNKIVWDNTDSAIHTATSGTSATDPNSAKKFDTGFIDPGKTSKEITITGAKVGDSFDYYCQVHPFMKGKITIAAASAGTTGGTAGASAGPTLHILSGASVQGAKAFDPTPLNIKKGDKVTVINEDNSIHSVTSGTGADDKESGKAFDSNLIDPGKTITLNTSSLAAGEHDFYCMVHPFMKGKMVVS
jgi:plastocyanin